MLTDRLRMLETEGIVFRDHEPTIAPKVTYRLTEKGNKFDSALQSIEEVSTLF